MSNIKKVELHLHLDGSLRPQTVLDILNSQFSTEEKRTIKEVESQLKIDSETTNLREYLKRFDLPIKVLQTKENLERVTYELLEDLSKEETIYVEVRVAPIQHISGGLTPSEVIEAILNGFKRAMASYPIKANLLLCAMRHLSPEKNNFLIDLACKYKNLGVVGLDLAGDEAGYPASIFKDFFLKAKENNIPFTIHAGEARGPESILEAIELGASRIGHGIRAYESDQLVEQLISQKICLECCPISNKHTNAIKNFNKYPILYYLNRGIPVTLNSDNRTVSNTNYEKEITFLREFIPLRDSQIHQFNVNAINHAFISDKTKEELLKKL